LVISEGRSSLIAPSSLYDWGDEATVVTAGGSNQQTYRATSTITGTNVSESPFSRREVFLNAVQSKEDAAALSAEARAELYKRRYVRQLTGTIQDTDAMQYGIDYQFGDIVVAEYLGQSYDAHVSTVHVTVTEEGEVLDNRIKGVI
jgi:hypothetical protein